ncbi:biliverdin-producing heme oxygenase [Massilia sp. PWRC2]|uniref:biliverdin-producing heme oxygenase n=1 Tax=Massilia sp. PWRC2 TaxID=2804626 RepID=UPI003CF76F43
MTVLDPIAVLRQATSAQHAILDSGLPLAQPEAGLPAYIAHLRMLARWLRPIDAWLAGFSDGPQACAGLPAIDRLARIDADLAAADAGEADELADPPWPLAASAAYRWGVAYVVEGSQLGGAVLYQRLAARLAPHPLTYLKPTADGPGPRWRAFGSALRAQVRSEAELADACAGACAAFGRILALSAR